MSNKKSILILSVIVILTAIIVTFTNPNLKKLGGTAYKVMPANSSFTDMNFYINVVINYYQNNSGSAFLYSAYDNMVDFNIKLSDEQLASITNFEVAIPFNDTKGIEKLINLQSFHDSNYGVKQYDFSNNLKLKSISISNSNVEAINIKNNVNLESIEIRNSKLSELILPKTKNLKNLTLENNNLSHINLSDNTEINNLNLSNNKLEEIDLSNNKNINQLNLSENKIKVIDLSKNSLISKLDLSNNKLEDLDISNLNNLININYLNIVGNDISTLKLNNANFNYDINKIISQNYKMKKIIYPNEMILEVNENVKLFGNSYGVKALIIENELSYKDFAKLLMLKNMTFKVFKNTYELTEYDTITDGDVINFYDKNNNYLFQLSIAVFNPIKTGFNDYYLYSIVTSNLGYKTNTILTSEQLSSVTNLSLNFNNSYADCTGIERLTGLKSLSIFSYISNVDIDNLNLENLVDLEYLSINNSLLDSINLKNNTKLINLLLSNTNLSDIDITKNINLRDLRLYNNKINNLNLSNNTELEVVTVDEVGMGDIDFSNCKKLVSLTATASSVNIVENKLLENLDLYYLNVENLDLSNNINLRSVDLSFVSNKLELILNEKIEELEIESFSLEKINLLNTKNLFELYLIVPSLTSITGIEESTNLKSLNLYSYLTEELDLSKLNQLSQLNLVKSPLYAKEVTVLKDCKIKYSPNIKLPSKISKEIYNEDDYVISFDNGIIKGLNVGNSAITEYFDTLDIMTQIPIKARLKYYVKVIDITSSKFIINKESKYIYVGDVSGNNEINRYIKTYGDGATKKIEDNIVKLYDDGKLFATYDIIKLNSKKYDISGNTIKYSGKFNLNKITVTNADLVVIDNELQVLYKGVIVKTFKLKEGK